MSSPYPIFDIVPPQQVRLCLTTLYHPRAPVGGTWRDCSPVGGEATFTSFGEVAPEDGFRARTNRDAWWILVESGGTRDLLDFTVAHWVRPYQQSRPLVNRHTSLWSTQLWSWHYTIYILGTRYTATISPLAEGMWAHVAYTQEGDHTRGYVDGQLVIDATTAAITPSARTLRFGVSGSNAPYADGDDFCLTSPLSAAQIRYLYESTRQRFGV